MPVTTIRTLRPTVLVALVLAAAACTPAPRSTGAPPSAPASTAAAPAGGQALMTRLAGSSVIGEGISGDVSCSYYAPGGSMTRVFSGFAPEQGTWTVEDANLCETIGGNTGCSRVAFQPNGQVALTSLEGSGVFTTMADIVNGNQCGA